MKYKICLSMFAVAMLIAAVTLNSYKITPTDTKSVAVNKVAETTTVTTTTNPTTVKTTTVVTTTPTPKQQKGKNVVLLTLV